METQADWVCCVSSRYNSHGQNIIKYKIDGRQWEVIYRVFSILCMPGHESYIPKDYTPKDKLTEIVIKKWFGQ